MSCLEIMVLHCYHHENSPSIRHGSLLERAVPVWLSMWKNPPCRWPLTWGKLPTSEGNGSKKKQEPATLLMAEILHQSIWRIYHYLQGFTYPRWCRISAITSMMETGWEWTPKYTTWNQDRMEIQSSLPLVVMSLGTKSWNPSTKFENTELGDFGQSDPITDSLGVHGVRPTSPVIPRGRGEIYKNLPL